MNMPSVSIDVYISLFSIYTAGGFKFMGPRGCATGSVKKFCEIIIVKCEFETISFFN